ncbi:MAG: zinc ribbon domain-containing protein [Chloroflexi bacterium]|nr:zinc ribbon domain-containing protein [Chloroflexota bacterium]
MRKFFLLLLIASLLIFPTLAFAQNEASIKELGVQLWPEYDRADMLVMYSLALADNTSLPTSLNIRIPADAKLNAVAKLSEGSMLTVPYDPPVRDGDWMVLTLVMDELTTYRVEYYQAMEIDGAARNFSFLWESDYDTESIYVEFQQPPSATDLRTTPVLPNQNPVAEGMTYHTFAQGKLPAGEAFELDISYNKNNDDLTVSSMPVEVSGVPASDTNSFSLSDSLPTILVGVGVLLIVGGLLYFFLAGRGQTAPPRKRTRSKGGGGEAKYCHECGSRASGNDKFCRSCGGKLRG